jgi:hypothetical protein
MDLGEEKKEVPADKVSAVGPTRLPLVHRPWFTRVSATLGALQPAPKVSVVGPTTYSFFLFYIILSKRGHIGHDHVIVCRNKDVLDTHVALGW